MSESVEVQESPSPITDGLNAISADSLSKSSMDSLEKIGSDLDNGGVETNTPKQHPMAFTINFGDEKHVDSKRLVELAKKSQARHQRVQSMSASLTRPCPLSHQKPPLSAKLPRKAQGYSSEGYFSSDQEEGGVSGSFKVKSSLFNNSPSFSKLVKQESKSPIVDSIMSRSDNFVSRKSLILPLKSANSLLMKDKTPSYGNLASFHKTMTDIIDRSPDNVMLNDISSPEFDVTPVTGLSSPEYVVNTRKPCSETPDLLFQNCPKPTDLFIDDEFDRQSNSSTGTYTIEGDNYTEEQKARMSIDRTINKAAYDLKNDNTLTHRNNINENINTDSFNQHKTNQTRDRNVLEISCRYESPTEDLAVQTSKQIKSTRSYLEKIKNRVRTITEKTFPKPQIKTEDAGSFTSVTTSGVLSSKATAGFDSPKARRYSLCKSELDQTDYVHRLNRETSVPASYGSVLPLNFESTPLKNIQKALRDERGMTPDVTTAQNVINKLSYMNINRCKGDKAWIQDWADSVKKYNDDAVGDCVNGALYGDVCDREKLTVSPRSVKGNSASPRSGTPTKIPSPVGTLLSRRTPDLIPQQDTESYLLRTQSAITNLQAKLHSTNLLNSALTSSCTSDRTLVSKLPVSQLSRSNSLNYRLKRRDTPGSPLRSPGNYVITGSRLPQARSFTRSLDVDENRDCDSPPGVSCYKIAPEIICYKSALQNSHRFDQARCRDTPRVGRDVARAAIAFDALRRSSSVNSVDYDRVRGERTRKAIGDDYRFSDDSESGDGGKIQHRRPKPRQTTPPKSAPVRRCPDTPEMSRKFGPGLVRNRVADRGLTSRMSEPPASSRVRGNQQKISEATRQAVFDRLTKPRSSVRESQQRTVDSKKPTQHRSPSVLAANKQVEFSNWKKRASYDPMKAAQEGRKRQMMANRHERNKDDMSSPSHSSPVHRSQSHATNISGLVQDYSSEDEDQTLSTLPDPMVMSTQSDILDSRDRVRRSGKSVMMKEYAADHKIAKPHVTRSRRFPADVEKRKTYIIDDTTPTRDNVDFLARIDNSTDHQRKAVDNRRYRAATIKNEATDRGHRATTIDNVVRVQNVDSDAQRRHRAATIDRQTTDKYSRAIDSDNSTTNGSSPLNSSLFSHDKLSVTTGTSDTEGESGTESAPVLRRAGAKRTDAFPKQRHSGEYSMSSSTTSTGQRTKEVQPRYLDISKYRSEKSPKNSKREKTCAGVAGKVIKGSAQHLEMEQKKQELEKWKRRASYDPRKSAAQAKSKNAVGAAAKA